MDIPSIQILTWIGSGNSENRQTFMNLLLPSHALHPSQQSDDTESTRQWLNSRFAAEFPPAPVPQLTALNLFEDSFSASNKIMEKIFDFMDVSTLLSCRYVCRKWRVFGALELQKRLMMFISFSTHVIATANELLTDDHEDCVIVTHGLSMNKVGRHFNLQIGSQRYFDVLHDLMSVMHHSDGLFPFNRFSIDTALLSTCRIQEFLSTVGSHVKHLYLTLIYPIHDNPSIRYRVPNLHLENFCDLLAKKTPNLASLKLSFYEIAYFGAMEYWDTVFLSKKQSVGSTQTKIFPNLRTFETDGAVSTKIIENVLSASPNLEFYFHNEVCLSDKLSDYLNFIPEKRQQRSEMLKRIVLTSRLNQVESTYSSTSPNLFKNLRLKSICFGFEKPTSSNSHDGPLVNEVMELWISRDITEPKQSVKRILLKRPEEVAYDARQKLLRKYPDARICARTWKDWCSEWLE